VSYFRLQKAGKISPRTIHRFLNSTSRLSQNAGQVKTASVPIENCLTEGVQSSGNYLPLMLLDSPRPFARPLHFAEGKVHLSDREVS
jgi:hypothetical protein